MKKIVNLILSNSWIPLMYKLNKYSSIKESNVILDYSKSILWGNVKLNISNSIDTSQCNSFVIKIYQY